MTSGIAAGRPATAPAALVETILAVDPAAADAGACNELLARLQRLRGWVDATEAQVTARVAELAAVGEARPVVDTHANTRGCSAREAEQRERRADAIGQAPSFGDALGAGEIGAAHVDAFANVLTSLTAAADAAVRDEVLGQAGPLLDTARTVTPEQFRRRLGDLVRRIEARHGVERDEQRRRDSYLSYRLDLATGMTVGRFALHPELAAVVCDAIEREVAGLVQAGEAAGDPDFVRRRVPRGRLAADTLGRLVGHGRSGPAQPVIADISVVVDVATLATGELHPGSICETRSGAPIPVSLLQRLGCDGFLTGIVVDDHGTALHHGRTRRHATPAQRRALAQQYRTCGLPGCDVEFDRCELHHIRHWWPEGGATDLDNLLPTCSRHHHLIHSQRWQLHLAPDRTLTVTDRHGRPLGSAPPPHRRPQAA